MFYKLKENFTAESIPPHIIKKINGVSYHENKDITLDDLVYLKVLHYDFLGNICKGELIANIKLAKELLKIFSELFDEKYPIEKLKLVDEFNADDEISMINNNSSCFNYRVIADTNTISMHGLGRAVDINPLYNPYIVGEKVMPSAGEPYADRSKTFPYKIDETDFCYKIFKKYGWLWGGHWNNSKDYQHFYKPDGKIKRAVMKIKNKFK